MATISDAHTWMVDWLGEGCGLVDDLCAGVHGELTAEQQKELVTHINAVLDHGKKCLRAIDDKQIELKRVGPVL